MKISIIVVGKAKDRALRELLDDYAGRIRRYAKLDEVEAEPSEDPRWAPLKQLLTRKTD